MYEMQPRVLIQRQHFESDEALSQLIESKFFEFYDEFYQNRTKLDMDVFNHFHELRFQIDEHQDRLKERIDDIGMKTIDETNKYEVMYLKNVKEKLSSFDGMESLEDKFNDIEETFRDTKLLIESIKDMQQKQKELTQITFFSYFNFKFNLLVN
jgi:hypothetical protein